MGNVPTEASGSWVAIYSFSVDLEDISKADLCPKSVLDASSRNRHF